MRLPCPFTRSPTRSGGGTCCSAVARIPLETNGGVMRVKSLCVKLASAIGRGRRGTLWQALTIARRCSWLLPQQPPTILTPNSLINSRSAAAIGTGSIGYTANPLTLSGIPAFGIVEMGSGQFSARKRTGSRICSGPVEQLRPTISTLSATSVFITAAISVPSSMRPLVSSETCAWIGTARPVCCIARRMPVIVALTSKISWLVSISKTSTPPSKRAAACSRKISTNCW